jgi:hypothetical protein
MFPKWFGVRPYFNIRNDGMLSKIGQKIGKKTREENGKRKRRGQVIYLIFEVGGVKYGYK